MKGKHDWCISLRVMQNGRACAHTANYVDPTNTINHPAQTIALARFFEYVVATYGYERLSVLLLGLSQHSTWETLLPAVFGVSQVEFEAGWQTYLAAHYWEPSF